MFFPMALFVVYGVLPYSLYHFAGNEYAWQMIFITLAGCLGLWGGWQVRIRQRMYLASLDVRILLALVWIPFILFTILVWATAERIPLIVALQGGDPDSIAYYREMFLKARGGWQASFVYINAALTGALIPYCIALMFYFKMRFRWWYFLYFLFYCISFMEKAYFFKALVPLVYLVVQNRIKLPFRSTYLLAAAFGMLLLVTVLSGLSSGGASPGGGDTMLSTAYAPSGPLALLVWRSVFIPALTAVDSLRTFYETFGGRYFLGGTSSFFTGLLGIPHVEFERAVFFAQWGQNLTGTGSSNAVYLIEAFVNWGYPGVLAISFLCGALIRLFAVSKSEPLRALWILFCYGLFTAGFIGLLMSNGFLMVFLLVFFFRLTAPSPHSRDH